MVSECTFNSLRARLFGTKGVNITSKDVKAYYVKFNQEDFLYNFVSALTIGTMNKSIEYAKNKLNIKDISELNIGNLIKI